jgi:hypothetical protein
MRRALFSVVLLVSFAGRLTAAKAMLLYNGRILVDASAEPANRYAGAALVQDGRFIAVGTLAAIDRSRATANSGPRAWTCTGVSPCRR